jgi:argininosuccinate synthase
MKQRVVLAYDGRPETSGAIAWLGTEHDADVVTLTLDLGGGAPLDGLRDVSLGRGAIRAHVLEVHEEFARDVLIPAAQAGTFRGRSIAALVAPLLARKLVDVARIEKASAIAYVTRDQDRDDLEAPIYRLDPAIPVIAITGTAADVRGSDRQRKSVPALPAAHVDISFVDSVPTAINAIAMRLPELVESLATIAAEHGIVSAEHALLPAAIVLHAAYLALAPARDGTVRLKLLNGNCHVEEGATARV